MWFEQVCKHKFIDWYLKVFRLFLSYKHYNKKQ